MFTAIYEATIVTATLQTIVMMIAMITMLTNSKTLKTAMNAITIVTLCTCIVLWILYACIKLFGGTSGSIKDIEIFLGFVAVITITIKYWLIRIRALRYESTKLDKFIAAALNAESRNSHPLAEEINSLRRSNVPRSISGRKECSIDWKVRTPKQRLSDFQKYNVFSFQAMLTGDKRYLVFVVAPLTAILNYVYVITL
jgi:hypothetical protein